MLEALAAAAIERYAAAMRARPLAPVLLALFSLMGAAACTTVTLEEGDAFDVKRTVSEGLLGRLGATRSEKRIEVEPGIALSAWHLERPLARGTVLYFGGNGYVMVNGHDILLGLLSAPVDVLTVDYRGYGQSDGAPSVGAFKRDALEVYDHLTRDLGVPPDRIVVHGQSLGSFVALFVASQRPVAGVVLETPVTNVEDLLDHLAPWWTRLFIRFEVAPPLLKEDNLARVEALEAPLLVLAGEEDTVAHPDMARSLFARAKTSVKRLEVLPGAKHNDLPPRDDYQTAYRAFLEEVLPERDPAREAGNDGGSPSARSGTLQE